MKPRIALIVPWIEQPGGGGVPSVARFLKDTAIRDGRYDLKLVSLATSAHDETNLGVLRPKTWWRGAAISHGTWEGLPFVHVGAVAGEFEFNRYLPRSVLARTVADCDILQVVCGSPAYANAVCGLGKPVSVQCATRAKVERRRRERNSSGPMGLWRRAMTGITNRLDDRALRSADAVQVENQWMYEYVRKINEGRELDLRNAPPGIDASTFSPAGRNLTHDPYLLCVGRLDDPRKNIGLLLDAYRLLPESTRTSLRLILAGTAGPPESFWRLAETAGMRDRIEFVHRPSLRQLVALYQGASMFVLTSDEEGLGVVLLEAMGCGIPVVSTRSGGPEGIITDGDDGFLVPLDDARMLARCVDRLHVDVSLNRTMGARARATVERRYAQEIAGRAFLSVWDRLLEASRPAAAS